MLIPACALAVIACSTVTTPPKFIDLDQEAGRQVVVDREEGQYLGHVSTLLLNDHKTILAAYPKGHGKGAIILKRSEDSGKTWSDRLPTPASWATSLETPTLFSMGGDRVILFSGLYPVRAARSNDNGKTWTELEPVGDWGGIVAMGSVIERHDGTFLAFFHDDGRFIHQGGKATGTFTVYQTESSDHGEHWSAPRSIWSGTDVHLCEPGALRSPDGKEIALLLRENKRVKPSHAMFSKDEGATWSTPRELPAALTGDRHTARYAPDGRLVVTFRDMGLTSDTKGDWVAWVGRWEDIAIGRTEGQYRVRLKDNTTGWDCGYPGLEVMPDGTFVATTYGSWTKGKPPWILSVRFKVEELDAEAAKAP